jgi:hypothetical protein
MSYECHKYYNGNLYVSIAKHVKNQQLFMNLCASTIMDVKKVTTRPICGYCNRCKKKLMTIYETYMWVSHI